MFSNNRGFSASPVFDGITPDIGLVLCYCTSWATLSRFSGYSVFRLKSVLRTVDDAEHHIEMVWST